MRSRCPANSLCMIEMNIALLADVEWRGYDITGKILSQDHGFPIPDGSAYGGSVRKHQVTGQREDQAADVNESKIANDVA